MPKGKREFGCGGQSIVELVVVLALVSIVVTAVVKGIGQRSVVRMQHVHEAFAEGDTGSTSAGRGTGGGTSGGTSSGGTPPPAPANGSSGKID